MSGTQKGSLIGGSWLIASVDTVRFPRTPDAWESADFATAGRRAEIRVAGGVGSVRIG